MTFELTQKPAFFHDLIQLPHAEQKKVIRALERLSAQPFAGQTKRIFGHAHKNLYRYRTGAYRIVFVAGSRTLSLLGIGKRDEVYDRFRPSGAPAAPSAEAVQLEPTHLPTVPDDPAPAHTLPDGGDEADPEETQPKSESPRAATALLAELLELWEVPEEARQRVLSCQSADELLEAGLPANVLEAVLHIQQPPDVSARVEQPTLALPNPSDLEGATGPHALTDFLLRLDPEQRTAADRHAQGPALVKGGAGTGKSVVALYRIRNLIGGAAQRDLFAGDPPRVLFLTYTRALTNASEQLLGRLLGTEAARRVDVRTLDSVAAELTGGGGKRAGKEECAEALKAARGAVSFDGGPLEVAAARRALERLQDAYLLDELDWVLDGQAVASLDEYVALPRHGRGTALGRSARGAVWKVYVAWRERLRADKASTHTQVEAAALARARELPDEKGYDVVVVDEAQDLKPVGIRLALAMCKSPEGFYLTADDRQSIYGRGFSWKAVSDDLRLQGRTTTLRRNYRSTRPIAAAAHAFLRAHGLEDDSATTEAVREGPRPVCLGHVGSEAAALSALFKQWAAELRVPLWTGAVLVRGRSSGQRLAAELAEQGLPARWVESKELDLEARVLKVMTMHAAKGLEFPMVAVAGVSERSVPPTGRSTQDEDDRAEWLDQERRLFHVAMTRAMRRLVVSYPDDAPSPFVADLDRQLWDWRTV